MNGPTLFANDASNAAIPTQSYQINNLSLSASVGSNILTIAMKDKAGNDPTSNSPAEIGFRDGTATVGTYTVGSFIAATSVQAVSGATLGHIANLAEYIYVYATWKAGVGSMAISTTRMWDEGSLQTTVTMSTSSDLRNVLYAPTGDSGVSIRLIGRIQITEATPGVWASAPSEISLFPSIRDMSQPSEIWLYGGNGWGSSDNKIRRYSTVGLTLGTGMTLFQGTSQGTVVTILKDGYYNISYVDANSGGDGGMGISKNSAQLTTAPDNSGFTITTLILQTRNSTAGYEVTGSATPYLVVGDVIRPHGNGANDVTATQKVMFRISGPLRGSN